MTPRPHRWRALPLSARALLPACPGVYVARAWWGLGGALYVGMSTDLYARWEGRRHHRLRQLPWHAWLAFQACPGWHTGELRDYERWLIRRLRPRLNYTRRRPWWRMW